MQVDTEGKGFIGLPLEWQKILAASGVPEEIVKSHPKTIESLMQVRMPESLQQQQQQQLQLPASPHSPNEVRNSPDPKNRYDHLPVGYAPPVRARSSKLLQLSNLSRSNNNTQPLEDTSSADDLPEAVAASDSHLALDSSFIDDIAETKDPNTLYSDFVLIAEGESGPMFAAKHKATGKLVAVKKINKTAQQKLSKIRNELTIMKMSRHPNVVEYFATYLTEDQVWVVMECMDVSLADIIAVHTEDADGLLLEKHMARTARDILRGLCRIHRLHRIHRDVRSDNILLNMRGEIKICKFSRFAAPAISIDNISNLYVYSWF